MMNEIQNGLTGITLNKIGKKFRNHWVFRNVELEIKQGDKIAVTGCNGSGKSTFLQLLSGYTVPTEGEIFWHSNQHPFPVEKVYKHLVFAAPYMELIEDFTLEENVHFFSRQKKLLPGISVPELMDKAKLADARSKQVRYFSSGMKQRLKLALAFLADTPLLLLDEPLSNLDASGYEWFQQMVAGIEKKRIVIICSNQVREETYFCDQLINIESFK